MADFSALLATIAANVYTNHNNEVTAAMVKTPLDQMVNTIEAEFNGIETKNGATREFTIDGTPSTYQNIGPLEGDFIITDVDTTFNGAIYGNTSGVRTIISSLPTIGQLVSIPSGYDYIEIFSRSSNTATDFSLKMMDAQSFEFLVRLLVLGGYHITHPGGANARYLIYNLPAGWYDVTATWSGAGANISLACYNGGTLVKAFSIAGNNVAGKFVYIDGTGYDTIMINTTSANAATDIDVVLTLRESVAEVVERSIQPSFRGNVCWKKQYATGAKFVVAGDSISVGYIGGGSFVTPNWPDRIATEFGGSVKNYGAGGATLFPVTGQPDVLTQLQGAQAAGDLDDCEAVFIYAGTNDYSNASDLSDVAGAVADINTYLGGNLVAGAKVYYITPINRTDGPSVIGGEMLDEYRRTIAEAALLGGHSVVDGGLAPFPSVTGTYASAVLTDGIHPTALGYDILSNFICGAIL